MRMIDFFAWTALPLNLKPQTRVGESRGLPGSLPEGHASISWGINKINIFFFHVPTGFILTILKP